MSDYFAWLDRHTRRRRPREEEALAETEEAVAPSEPLEVEEHHASTTVIQKIRDAIRDRFRSP